MVTYRLIGICIIISIVFGPTESARSQWIPTNAPIDSKVLCLAASESNLFVGTEHGVYRSTNDGEVWEQIDDVPPLVVSALVSHGTTVIAALYDSLCYLLLYRSIDNGTSWTQLNPDPRPPRFWTLATNGSTFFAETPCGIFRSTDAGESWTSIDSGIMDPPHFNIDALTVHDSNVFIKTGVGECSFGAPNTIFRSTNNGTVWTEASDGLNGVNRMRSRITALASIGSTVFAAGQDTIFQWVQSASHWTSVGNIHAYGYEAQSLVVSGTSMFAGLGNPVKDRIIFSSDSGKNWRSVSEGLENASIYSNPYQLVVSNGYLFVGIVDHGVWRRPLSEMIGKSKVREVTPPNSPLLSFPNPLSTSTQISFTTETGGQAEVSIVNLFGVEVTHLFSGPLESGKHQFTWNTSMDVPDGVYECIVRMHGTARRTAMVLMR
jgi:photosystem II stability/assembly factor-like uncharacterized protein